MKTWTPKPELYDFGRPFPPEQVVQLFPERRLSPSQRLSVFEPGCGTGRILGALASRRPDWSFVGSDSSEVVLQVFRRKCDEQELHNVHLFEGTLMDEPPARAFDLLIVSSLLHVVPDWENAVRILLHRLKPGGLFCLIGDTADLYDEVLGRKTNGDVDSNLSLFWRLYREIRESVGAPSTEASQIGCRWDLENSEVASFLNDNKWSEVFSEGVSWIQHFTREQLLKIVRERCYSSMFTVEQDVYDRLLARLEPAVANHVENIAVTSRHTAVARFFRNASDAGA